MIYAGEFWRAHPSVKNYYGRLAHPGMERYRAQMTDYHLKKNLLKRPGHAYVRFVKSFCQVSLIHNFELEAQIVVCLLVPSLSECREWEVGWGSGEVGR